MNQSNMKVPVGLDSVVSAIQKNVEQAELYRCSTVKLPHYLVNLDKGEGQTRLTEYMVDCYFECGIRRFGGMDLYLEYALDGSLQQIKKVFANIRSCAVYTNTFEGVIALDISKLANYVNETQVKIFIDELVKVGEDATLLLYVPSVTNRNVLALIKKIQASLNNLEVLHVMPYTTQDLVQIVKEMIVDAGIALEESERLNQRILAIVEHEKISNISQVKKLSQKMMKQANLHCAIPRLEACELEMFVNANKEKREVTK